MRCDPVASLQHNDQLNGDVSHTDALLAMCYDEHIEAEARIQRLYVT